MKQKLVIKKINLYQVKIPFSVQVSHNLADRIESKGILVEICSQNGSRGYGEGTPRSYVTGEKIEDTIKALKSIAKDLINSAIENKDNFFKLIFEHIDNYKEYPSALCAFELALFDLFAKEQNVPVWKLLNGTPSSQDIFYSSILPLLPQKSRKEILYLTKQYKIKQIKAKVMTISKALKVVSEITNILGETADIRLDANGAFSKEEAIELLNALNEKNFKISCLEQPVAKQELEGLREIEEKSGVPVMADESFCNEKDLEEIINNKICSWINIRISKCGGLLRSKMFIEKAQKAGISCQLGCHVGETSILSAAARHLAVVCGPFKYVEGCYSKFLLEEDVVENPLEFGHHGKAKIPLSSGLGVKINEKALGKYCKKIFEL